MTSKLVALESVGLRSDSNGQLIRMGEKVSLDRTRWLTELLAAQASA